MSFWKKVSDWFFGPHSEWYTKSVEDTERLTKEIARMRASLPVERQKAFDKWQKDAAARQDDERRSERNRESDKLYSQAYVTASFLEGRGWGPTKK